MLRIAKVENGTVQGLPAADPRITSFKGIPFAAPPIGDNRWRAPQPAADWEGVLHAYQFAPVSMQVRQELDDNNIYTREWAVEPDIAMSEDCLYLNVWTPAKHPGEKLPVFVWYFGGGLQVGHPAEMEFDGERIARRGIVVVTINYRLNAFGFLCHPEITAEAPEAPANFGNLDQQAATRWVKRNIAAFGGDPDNITIGGQFAGGGSVMSQLTSPQNEGLFRGRLLKAGFSRSCIREPCCLLTAVICRRLSMTVPGSSITWAYLRLQKPGSWMRSIFGTRPWSTGHSGARSQTRDSKQATRSICFFRTSA